MNSSTSISEQGWARLLRHYAAWLIGLGALVAALILALDPYDSGRFALFPSVGVPHFGQRLADASLARDPQFDAAIIGNSTIQLVDPSHLKGVHAVSLAIPGTGPREQLTVARYFLRHHQAGKTSVLVLDLDDRWCMANRPMKITHPFPFWLYQNSGWNYAVHMLRYQSFEAAGRKIRLLLGKEQPLRADGYNDYDAGRVWDRAGFRQRLSAPDEEDSAEAAQPPPYVFPASAMLSQFLGGVPAQVRIILVMPPQFEKNTNGDEGLQQHACRKAFIDLASQRPRTVFIDFLDRPALTSHEEDFWDRIHYRARVARAMEEEIDKY